MDETSNVEYIECCDCSNEYEYPVSIGYEHGLKLAVENGWTVISKEDKEISCPECSKIHEDLVEAIVEKGLESQFMMYSFDDMINDCDLTAAERKWAKEHLTYGVKRINS